MVLLNQPASFVMPRGKYRCGVLASFVLAVIPLVAIAQTEVADANSLIVSPDEIVELVRQLGAHTFRQREEATRKLSLAGLDATVELERALKHRDREVRDRAQRVLIEIARQDRPRRMAKLLGGGPVGDVDRPLALFGIPGMDIMFSIAGDTPEARRLLAAALQSDWDFCEAIFEPNRRSVDLIEARCTELRSHRSVAADRSWVGAVVAILLGVVHNPDALSDNTAIQVYSVLNQLELSTSNEPNGELWEMGAFRRLIGHFIVCCDGPTATYQGLNVSLRFNLPEGLQAAERVIRDGRSLPFVRQYAILTIARFGNERHIEDLQNLMNDDQICFTRRTTLRNSHFECQICDLAMATILHLVGRDPRQFGFMHLQFSQNYVFQPHTVGFDNDELRQMARLQFQIYAAAPHLP